MGKIDKLQQARMDGMCRALEIKRNKFDDAAEFIKEFWGEEFFKYEN